jgi:hypothetical protein
MKVIKKVLIFSLSCLILSSFIPIEIIDKLEDEEFSG